MLNIKTLTNGDPVFTFSMPGGAPHDPPSITPLLIPQK